MELPAKWKAFLPDQSARLERLGRFLEGERTSGNTVYPPKEQVFSALLLPPEDVRVVLLGQDPYHGAGQANGMAFSVPAETPLPPSLRNIFKELHDDTGNPLRKNGDLSDWQDQGVLLLNRTLTVRAGQAGSHQGQGWEEITSDIIGRLSEARQSLVFLLLGARALEALPLIEQKDRGKHTTVKAPHPSPLSAYRGFFGSRVWSQVNSALPEPICWG